MLCTDLRHCVASKLHSGAGLRQNPHDLEALLAVCAWFHAETNAAQEMLAFEPQRLPLLDSDPMERSQSFSSYEARNAGGINGQAETGRPPTEFVQFGPVTREEPMISNRLPVLAFAAALLTGTTVMAYAQAGSGGSGGASGNSGAATGSSVGTGGSSTGGADSGGSSLTPGTPGSSTGSGVPASSGRVSESPDPAAGTASPGQPPGADQSAYTPEGTIQPRIPPRSGARTTGSNPRPPRQGVATGGSLGDQTGAGNMGAETDRERRAQKRSDAAIRGICKGC
jgi:hypothetical protein